MKKGFLTAIVALAAVAIPFVTPHTATADGTENGYYYEQLSSPQAKEIYNAIKASPLGMNATAELSASVALGGKTWENVLFVRSTESGDFSLNSETDEEASAWFDQVSEDTMSALYALLYDEPELSWLVNVGYAFSSTSPGGSVTIDLKNPLQATGDYTVNVTLEIKEEDQSTAATTGTSADFQAALNVAVTALQEDSGYDIDGAGKSRYEKVKAIHDYVCETVTYATGDLTLREYQTVYSGLVSPTHTTVCAGYAKTFKVLCDYFEIPCVLVSGTANNGKETEDHMWNYVQMQSGLWYAVDTTWDDTSKIRYEYFLKGETTFDKDHFEDGKMDERNTFEYPNLSVADYSPETDGPVQTWNVTQGEVGSVTAFLLKNATQTGKYDLLIEGDGQMLGAESFEETPWAEYAADILSVRIGKGVVAVGENSFTGFSGIKIYAHENSNVDEEYPELFESLCTYSDCEDESCNGCGGARTPKTHVDQDEDGVCDECNKALPPPSSGTQNSGGTTDSSSVGSQSAGVPTDTGTGTGGCFGSVSGGTAFGVGVIALALFKKKRR